MLFLFGKESDWIYLAVAALAALIVVRQARLNSLLDNLGNLFIHAQRGGDMELNARMEGGGFGGEAGNISGAVAAGGEEVGMNDDGRGTLSYTFGKSLGDGRLRKFH